MQLLLLSDTMAVKRTEEVDMDAKSEAILERLRKERDSVPRAFELWAEWDAPSLEDYHNLWMNVRDVLSPKMVELLYVAIDATQLFESGLAAHIRGAFKAGATPQEVWGCLLVAYICAGIHVLGAGMPIFADAMKELGISKE